MIKAGEYVYGTDGHEGHWLTGEEVVRCRDCKAFLEGATPNDVEQPHFCTLHGTDLAEPDGFCAWGERMDE